MPRLCAVLPSAALLDSQSLGNVARPAVVLVRARTPATGRLPGAFRPQVAHPASAKSGAHSGTHPRVLARAAPNPLTPEPVQSPSAVSQIRTLLASPTPQLLRIGVRNKGCAGMSYHLEYVDRPDKFDEIVEQDGVKVVLDSKALFSIIGSEMEWEEGPLGAKFVFKSQSAAHEHER